MLAKGMRPSISPGQQLLALVGLFINLFIHLTGF